jgi:hypothetical protein
MKAAPVETWLMPPPERRGARNTTKRAFAACPPVALRKA